MLLVLPSVSGSVFSIVVLPEGWKHYYGCNERDEGGGVAHSVNLSEHREVACLEGRKQKKEAVSKLCFGLGPVWLHVDFLYKHWKGWKRENSIKLCWNISISYHRQKLDAGVIRGRSLVVKGLGFLVFFFKWRNFFLLWEMAAFWYFTIAATLLLLLLPWANEVKITVLKVQLGKRKQRGRKTGEDAETT